MADGRAARAPSTRRATSTRSCATACARPGSTSLLVDTGVLGEPRVAPDIDREEVARAAGADHADLVRDADRGQAMDVMGRGAAAVLTRLHGEGRVDGVAAIGGSGNSSIAARAMRDLPVGVPEAHRLDRRRRATPAPTSGPSTSR